VAVDYEKIRKTFAKDLNQLVVGVKLAAEAILYGSYAARTPHLGKMVRCPYCKRRKRAGAIEKCCNPKYRVSIESLFPKKMLRRMMHKRHGQNRNFKMLQMANRLYNDEAALNAAAEQMQVPVPTQANIASFAEKYWLWLQEREDKRLRRQADTHRRINRGLATRGAR
jgi:hypothetical protein